MLAKYISAAMLGTALLAVPAFSQTPAPATRTDAAPAMAPTTTLHDKWRASKLIGVDVYNEQNEKLGDISELVTDKNGKIDAVIIGVGGFLGMGQHDISVSWDKLKFVNEPVRTTSASTTTSRPATGPMTGPATTGSGANTASGSATTTATAANRNDWYPDHAVLSATKDQLKAMPAFSYSETK